MTGVVTILAACAGLIAAIPSEWVPVTRGTYDQDMNKIVEAIGSFELRWLCDEWKEELNELLDIEPEDQTPRQAQRVLDLRERLSENNCYRFDD